MTEPVFSGPSMAHEVVLHIRGLNKAYPGVQALDDVSMEIRKGEIHALLGQNGAGKSTLIKLLSGADQPDSGSMQLDGRNMVFRTPHESQRAGIFTIYQEMSLIPDLSVAENIFIADLPKGRTGIVSWPQLKAHAASTMEWIGFSIDVNQPVRALSVAQKQGVELAKALHHDARVVLLDEPSAALPQPDVQRLFKVLRVLRSRGLALVYISHRLEEVEQLCDIATVLRDGRKVDTYVVSEATQATLIRAMIGRDLKSTHVGEVEKGQKKSRLGNGGDGTVVLSVHGLNDGFAIHDINFDLHRGEILGITGLIGNGQTELAACIFGAREKVAGEIRFDGKPVRIRTPDDAINVGIGLLPEERKTQGLILHMSIESNITMASHKEFSHLTVIDRRKEKSAVDRMIASLGVRTSDTRRPVGTLSGGNQQKIVLAKWLVSKCKVLVFSEPTRGIDVEAKEDIYELIAAFVRNGGSVILISSEIPEASMCDRVLVMSRGYFAGELLYGDIDPHSDVILDLCCK
jgi:ribose transport system ATP-binding protein